LAPFGTIVKVLPVQIVPLFTATEGRALTVTVEIAGMEIHPLAAVPVTE
jgi:hypothetical protein